LKIIATGIEITRVVRRHPCQFEVNAEFAVLEDQICLNLIGGADVHADTLISVIGDDVTKNEVVRAVDYVDSLSTVS